MTTDRGGNGAAGDSREQARLFQRYFEPVLTVMIDQSPYQTIDWSSGGMSVSGYQGPLDAGDQTSVEVVLPAIAAGRFTANIRVLRKAATGALIFVFEHMPTEGYDLLDDLRMAMIARIADQDQADWSGSPLEES